MATPNQPTKPEVPQGGNKDIEENKVMAVLAYVGILVLVPLLAAKDSKFAQYHAKQGLVVFIAEIILVVINVIPVVGWIVSFIGFIIVLILSIMGIVNALNGKEKELPILGQFAGKFNI